MSIRAIVSIVIAIASVCAYFVTDIPHGLPVIGIAIALIIAVSPRAATDRNKAEGNDKNPQEG
ncbi:hypothetical protein [Corynebacterium kroppenstedtii]|jgi:hypothetical protein|uniref:Uncharacterized protein n=1 Tax=Corynebacterium kroppenstedtii TaxID=161879 RepID=A0A2W5SYQ3_9CORY|nr:hypothetical protein [Corynebacterium kroppenstedtii]MDU7286944.1 hypothetical protein [Corynebacterium kroppenstedtii]PZR05773.1 MAG: hypothetical protein DI525_03795 [Corynebacterium kroppenstedtii]